MARRFFISIAAAVTVLGIHSAGAWAATVTVGSPQPGAVIGSIECPRTCATLQKQLPGVTLSAPIDGVIVRWRFADGKAEHHYRLRVMRPLGGLTFQAVASSAEATASGFGLETFPAAIPVQAGDQIAIELDAEGTVAARAVAGARQAFFKDPFTDGVAVTGVEPMSELELGFNADVQPAPKIAFVDPPAGPLKGGNLVEITGGDFEGASAVRFGGVPAKSYRVDSGGLITAIAPPADAPALVPISVTTGAGTATTPPEYEYRPKTAEEDGQGQPPPNGGGGGSCTVPKLKGKKLKAAKRKLKRAHCRIGRVKRKGATAKAGRVVKQRPKAGKALPAGAKVSVTLANAPAGRSAGR
jgi:hypothetical protein